MNHGLVERYLEMARIAVRENQHGWEGLLDRCRHLADACHQAALAICEYRNVSPEDEWLDQLISMRDFACAAASRTPDLQFVKVDERVPEYRPRF